jgi:hypothetical protein
MKKESNKIRCVFKCMFCLLMHRCRYQKEWVTWLLDYRVKEGQEPLSSFTLDSSDSLP